VWRRTARDRVFIAFLILSTVTVLTLDFRTGVLNGVSNETQSAFSFLQTGVRGFVRPFQSVLDSIGDLGSLRNQNAKLRAENLKLQHELEVYPDVARENDRLTTLLQLQDSAGIRAVEARVIGASISALEQSVTINKGRNDGIVPDRAVLAPEGLAGHITWAGASSAQVTFLTDLNSAVGVRVGNSGETGLVRGNGPRSDLKLELISRPALDQGAVKQGDMVVTSGYQGGIYPAGLPVGRVEKVELAARGTNYTIFVRPFVRFSQLDILSVAVSTSQVVEAPPSPTPGTNH
jgi:rod shape-determining protein MreC